MEPTLKGLTWEYDGTGWVFTWKPQEHVN